MFIWFAGPVHIDFHASAEPTLGVEWELALVDKKSRDLVNGATELLSAVPGPLRESRRVHGELLRNTVELVTGVCSTVPGAMRDLDETLAQVRGAADALGVDLFGAGTHPFAAWSRQVLTPGERYEELINRTQWWGRQMLIWGVHVHVGMPDRERVLPVLSALLTYQPHLQALSASSPVWAGTDTGYASNRALMFQQLPTAGLPFQFEEWTEFERFAEDQILTGVINDLSEIRWDVRPSAHFGTIENRVCDGVSNLRELSALVALMHCLVVDLDERCARGEQLPMLPPWHVQENKWRAARYGMEAIVVLDAASNERLVTEDLAELLTRLQPVAERIGCAQELALVGEIVLTGASYQRQREVARHTGDDLVTVVDAVVGELEHAPI